MALSFENAISIGLKAGAFRDRQEFQADLDGLLDRLRANPPSDPDLPVLVPGDSEHDTVVVRRSGGIPMTAALRAEVEAVCQESGAEFILP